MKVVTIIGARPQFIKASAVSRTFRGEVSVEEILVHTGQHYDDNMSEVFFRELDIPRPLYNLAIGSGPHGQQTGRMLEQIEAVMQKVHPDVVLVYGDTNSTLAGSLAAVKLHIPVAHVEAGLRSFNRRMPEEINRILTDHVSALLFAPTATAIQNLRSEGITHEGVHLVGDVMYDVTLSVRDRVGGPEGWGLSENGYVLATVHRAENTDDPRRLIAIHEGLRAVAQEIPVVWPVHPRTRDALQRLDLLPGGRLQLLEPLGYLQMACLEKHARLIVTDSGGVQKEAFFHGVPCVTLRDETEWVELVEMGWNRLLPPTSAEAIGSGVLQAVHAPHPSEVSREVYGGGHASRQIVNRLLKSFG